MVMREPARGEDDSCRDRAVKSVQKLIDSLPHGQTEEERYKALQLIAKLTTASAQRCADNFGPEEFLARKIPQNYSPQARVCLLDGLEGAAHRLAVVQEEMAKSGLCKVNGTSVVFAECAKQKEIFFNTAAQARQVNEVGPYGIGNIDDDRDGPSPSAMKGLQQKLILSLNYLAGIVLVFEDMLAA